MMKYPCLVPESVCQTPIKIYLTDGIGEDGAPLEKLIFEGKCNYTEKSRQVLDAERRLVRLEATVLLRGDTFPLEEKIEGYAEIKGGLRRTIFSGNRARNPDATVNYTRLELM